MFVSKTCIPDFNQKILAKSQKLEQMVLDMNFIQNVTKDPALNAEIVCYMLDRILANYTPHTLFAFPQVGEPCGLQCFLDFSSKIFCLKGCLSK